MKWRVSMELAGAEEAVAVHEVSDGERRSAGQQRKALQVLDGLDVRGVRRPGRRHRRRGAGRHRARQSRPGTAHPERRYAARAEWPEAISAAPSIALMGLMPIPHWPSPTR